MIKKALNVILDDEKKAIWIPKNLFSSLFLTLVEAFALITVMNLS